MPCGVPWQWRPGGPGVVPASGPRGGGAVAVVVRARGGRAGCPRWLVRLPPVGSAVRALVGAVVVHCGGALRWCTTRAPPGGVWVPAPVVRGCPGAGCPRPGRGAPPRPRAEEVAAAGSGGAGGAGRRTVLLGGRKFPVRPTLAAGSLSATGLLTLNRKNGRHLAVSAQWSLCAPYYLSSSSLPIRGNVALLTPPSVIGAPFLAFAVGLCLGLPTEQSPTIRVRFRSSLHRQR